MKIKLGADELILWLRKNGIANDIPNDEVQGLGFKICRIIENLGGEKKVDNYPVFWPISGDDNNMGKLKLPKTAAQYEIDIEILPEIYRELSML